MLSWEQQRAMLSRDEGAKGLRSRYASEPEEKKIMSANLHMITTEDETLIRRKTRRQAVSAAGVLIAVLFLPTDH